MALLHLLTSYYRRLDIYDSDVEDIVQRVWLAKTERHAIARAAQARLIANTNLSAVQAVNAYDLFEPVINCEDEFRLGNAQFNVGDGPKWVCGLHRLKNVPKCIVYSIGSYWDFSFEFAVLNAAPECKIHTFDGTMDLNARPLPKLPPAIQFHNYNVVADCDTVKEQAAPSRCFSNILKDLHQENTEITWLKIDCEGCEYSLIPAVLGLQQVTHVMIEVHGVDPTKIASLFRTFEISGLFIFHKERNHWGCSGWECVEFSLMTTDYSKSVLESFIRA